MKNILKISLLSTVILSLAVGGVSAYGFQDTKGDPAEAEIIALSQAGVVSGINDSQFDPQGAMTLAQGVQIIVRGLALNMDALRFIKEPVASDMFDYVQNDAWYAKAMVIAFHNGLTLPRNANPHAKLTEGAFTQLLTEGLRAKTEKEAPAKLFGDASGGKAEVTRSKAVQLTARVISFLNEQKSDQPQQQQSVTVERTKAGDGVDLITLTWPERPSAGYSLRIEGIDFQSGDGKIAGQDDMTAPNGTDGFVSRNNGGVTGTGKTTGVAVIRYSLHEPKPGSMNAQVITDVKATTFVGSHWKIELQQVK
jgi:hypothetical protein